MENVSYAESGRLPVIITSDHSQKNMTRKRNCRYCSWKVAVSVLAIFAVGFSATALIYTWKIYQKVLMNLDEHSMKARGIADEMMPMSDILDVSEDTLPNGTSSHSHHIGKRDTHGQGDTVAPFNYESPSRPGVNNFIHVSGIQMTDYEKGQWVTWYGEEDPHNTLSRQNMPFKQDKFIIIPKPGYYYIYTQLTYENIIDPISGVFRVGHEVIRQSHCGHGESEILLSSWMSQSYNQTATDSTHMGGTFYLSTNDRIGVRMKRGSSLNFELRSNPRSLCNFGAFTVMPDTSFDDRIDNTCCCLDA